MTTIIRVDPDDELPAILERLPSGASCVMVLPPHARALSSAVGAKLLARRAEAMGTAVAVVSDDSAVLAHVRAAGLPVAATLDEAQRLLPASGADGANEPTIVTRPVASGAPEAATPNSGAAAKAALRRAQEPDKSDTVPGNGAVGGMQTPAPRDTTTPYDAGTQRFTAGAASGAAPPPPDDDLDDPDAVPPQEVRGHSGAARASGAGRPATGNTARQSAPASQPARPRRARGKGVVERVIVPAALVILPLLVILAAAYYVLSGLFSPTATLTVAPRAGSVAGNAAVVHADAPLPRKRKAGAYYVPLFFSNQPEQGTRTLPVRGIKRLPGQTASGVLRLGNLTTKALFVPRGTAFTTALNAESFVSTRDITLPAAQESFSLVRYGTGSVPISATIGGSASNVSKGAIVNVPAFFAGALKIQNDQPTTGGTDIIEHVVDPRDLARTANSLFAALEARAHGDVNRLHGGGGNLEQHTLFAARSSIAPVVAPDHRTATLSLSVVVHVAYVRKSDLRPAATTALQPALGALQGASYIANSINWTAAWQPDTHHGYTITLAVSGRTQPNLDIPKLRQALKGLSRTAAAAYLHSQPDLATSSITLSPPWADHLPDDTTHIHINVQGPR